MHQKRNPHALSPEHVLFGNAVRQLRARRGLSQEHLGFQAGLHRNYVGAIERGEINLTLRTLLKLCRGFRMPASEVMTVFEENIRREHDEAAREPGRELFGGLVTVLQASGRHSASRERASTWY